MDGRHTALLLQLLFVTYYPFRYKPCVEVVTDKKSSFVSVRKTKRKFEKIFTWIPIFCLLMAMFLCGFALLIATIESKTHLELVLNPKVWTWGIGVLLAFSGTIWYKVWILNGVETSIKMANEIITLEQELLTELSPIREHSPKHLQFFDWVSLLLYLTAPMIVVAIVNVGGEPFLFCLKYFLKFDTFFSTFRHIWLPGYGRIVQIIITLLLLWPSYNFVMYELIRTFLFCASSAINASAKAFSILLSLQKQVTDGVSLRKKCSFLYYSRFRIISQSVDSAVSISIVIIITSVGMMVCTATFIAVRLHKKYSTGMILINGFGAVVFLLLLDMLLTLFGRCDEICRNFLWGCKNAKMLGMLIPWERKAYLKEVNSLPRWILYAGTGKFRLTKVTKEGKVGILFYVAERIVNVLIAFR
ncbi:hypothetical protein Fcan01_16904 [Folsomia candida]|uniref:Gustatory receptor n=1 Tax=Folsomia candida TaxID=158441 RepID=A0A226DVU2_FOLCA|nr:hypothetical protein Fcan01_16904 [Folsomia candida]